MSKHRLSWDGPFGRVYIENCTCGWSHLTFADSRESGIGVAYDEHVRVMSAPSSETGE